MRALAGGEVPQAVLQSVALLGGTESRWTPAFAAFVAGVGCLAFLPVPFWVAEVWLGGLLGGAASGLFTFPICIMLLWLARRQPSWRVTPESRPGAEWALLALVLLNLFGLYIAAGRWDALMISAMSLPAAIWVWCWGSFGWARAKTLLMPIGFGYFALPYEYFLRRALDLPLQAWTADIAYVLLNLLGYGLHYFDDYTIYTHEYYVIVNETCSGMNMLVTLAMYTLIFGWIAQPKIRNRLLLLALVVPLAMLANGIRVSAIWMMGHYAGNELAMGPWHDRSAYIIFLPVFWFLYIVNQALLRRLKAKRSPATTSHITQSG